MKTRALEGTRVTTSAPASPSLNAGPWPNRHRTPRHRAVTPPTCAHKTPSAEEGREGLSVALRLYPKIASISSPPARFFFFFLGLSAFSVSSAPAKLALAPAAASSRTRATATLGGGCSPAASRRGRLSGLLGAEKSDAGGPTFADVAADASSGKGKRDEGVDSRDDASSTRARLTLLFLTGGRGPASSAAPDGWTVCLLGRRSERRAGTCGAAEAAVARGVGGFLSTAAPSSSRVPMGRGESRRVAEAEGAREGAAEGSADASRVRKRRRVRGRVWIFDDIDVMSCGTG